MQTRTHTCRLSIFAALAALVAAFAAPAPASAQFFGRSQEQQQGGETAELLLRVDRLENQVRALNGQIEQMQFQLRRSEEMLKKFQQDVEFRFQELQQGAKTGAPRPATPQRRSELEPETDGANGAVAEVIPAPAIVPRGTGPAAAAGALAGGVTPRNGRGDAFDPATDPDAPGAPRPLGSPASASTPLARPTPTGPLGADNDPNAPLDLMGPRARRDNLAGLPAPASPVMGTTPQQAPAPASLPPTTPRDEFDTAVFTLEQGQYDAAATGLRTFLQRYPKDPLSGEATYFLGESYFRRGKHRDAAEQYLKISTDFPKTAHAPEAMLRLGQSLEKLGAKEQACAFYAELPRKFPHATSAKASAQREAKKAQC